MNIATYILFCRTTLLVLSGKKLYKVSLPVERIASRDNPGFQLGKSCFFAAWTEK